MCSPDSNDSEPLVEDENAVFEAELRHSARVEEPPRGALLRFFVFFGLLLSRVSRRVVQN